MDSNLCFKAHSIGIPIVDIGAPVYHVGHGTLNTLVSRYRDRPGDAPWGNVYWNNQIVYVNPVDWGLARAPRGGSMRRPPTCTSTGVGSGDRRPPGVVLPSVRKGQSRGVFT